MTTSFPVTKTGLRFGLATALVGCLALALIAGPGAGLPTIRCWRRSMARKSRRATSPWPRRNSGEPRPDGPGDQGRERLSFLIDMKIVGKAAEDKKFGDGAEFKKRLAFARNSLLMDSLLARGQGRHDPRRHEEGL